MLRLRSGLEVATLRMQAGGLGKLACCTSNGSFSVASGGSAEGFCRLCTPLVSVLKGR